MSKQLFNYHAGSKRPASSTSGNMTTPSKRLSINAKSPRSAFPFEPPTVGTKVHPNGHQVQSAESIKDLSPAKKRLFDIPPDSQSAPLKDIDDDVLSSESGEACNSITGSTKKLPCQLCQQEFTTERLLKIHQKKCRPQGSKFVKSVLQNGWQCSICKASGDSRFDFKKHIFHNHNDLEVEQYYQRSWSSLIS